MYEWENEVPRKTLELNLLNLQEELKRIQGTTLRGKFTNPDDRKYWELKAKQVSSKIAAYEEILKSSR